VAGVASTARSNTQGHRTLHHRGVGANTGPERGTGRHRWPASRTSPSARRWLTRESRALEPLHVDEPSLSMTIGINTSPLAGTEGKLLTARMVKTARSRAGRQRGAARTADRSPDAWEVQGRGELQLGDPDRDHAPRGFELTVGKPQVVTASSRTSCTNPWSTSRSTRPMSSSDDQHLARHPKGHHGRLVNHGTGWVRMEWRIPAEDWSAFAPSS